MPAARPPAPSSGVGTFFGQVALGTVSWWYVLDFLQRLLLSKIRICLLPGFGRPVLAGDR
ncbi:hypothetical protein [Glutamicibacter endophyticus]|uniref:hypothetical protein n=1 Tax=Glutamicibacter endophyticus TaxID=1522174 RepID=UPI003AF15C66